MDGSMSVWDGVEEFVMVARTGSFTVSASRLNVSTSHVSRRVKSLEDRLGVKLLARTTRAVKLTDLGRDYLNRVDELIGGIDDANQAITGAFSDLAGPVRVSAAGPFAEAMVMPILLEFAELNPQITLEVDFNNRNVDLVEEGYDFAIRYGALANSTLIARKLATRKLICAASPAYLERYGEPSTPQDLRQHSCISANNNVWQFLDPSTQKGHCQRKIFIA
jgi:DNA-binding transcriptional LysR family regulator